MQAYRFNVDLQRLWCQKHRHLDWVKDELAEAARQWHESAQPRPADTVPPAAGSALARAAGASDGHQPQGGPTKPRPRIARYRYLAIVVAVVILLLGATAAAHVFPFSPSAHGPGNSAQNRSLTQNLVQLMPGDLARNPQQCHSTAPSDPWAMQGLLLELQCTVPELSGTVYAYQLDNAADYEAAWQNFNQWWGFQPARAGKGCPPKGASQGIDTSTGSELPQASLPVTECGMQTPSPGKTVAAYAWGCPTFHAFVLARAAPGSSFEALHSWSIGQLVPRGNLQKIIPTEIQRTGTCQSAGTQFGATAVTQCSRLSLAAGTIHYYLYPTSTALTSGINQLLSSAHFRKERECTSGSDFTGFLTECQSDFHNTAPFMTGTIAEYISQTTPRSSSPATASRTSWPSWSGPTPATCWRTGRSSNGS